MLEKECENPRLLYADKKEGVVIMTDDTSRYAHERTFKPYAYNKASGNLYILVGGENGWIAKCFKRNKFEATDARFRFFKEMGLYRIVMDNFHLEHFERQGDFDQDEIKSISQLILDHPDHAKVQLYGM